MQPIKLFENFLLLFKWNALTWQILNYSKNQGVTPVLTLALDEAEKSLMHLRAAIIAGSCGDGDP
jgi:hypothetical protein